ncbi:MAG: hypothetical protein ACKOWR_06090 [Micrococcales bacterium]
MSDQKPPMSKKTRTGLVLLIVGAVVAWSPLAMAFLSTTPGHNMWSEGDSQSGGTYLWGMMITLPMGFIIGVVGLVLLLSAAVAPKPVTRAATESEVAATGQETVTEQLPNPNSKGLGIVMIVLGAGLAIMWIPVAFSLIGGLLVLTGAFVMYRGILLLRKPKQK